MTTPTVTEVPPTLEPTTTDSFVGGGDQNEISRPLDRAWLDATGPVGSSAAGRRGRMLTAMWHCQRSFAATVRGISGCEQLGLVRSAGAVAALSLENKRLNAELLARLEELRGSRARLVQAGDAERRRLERDLHDGAQQRLVSLLLNLNLARRNAADGSPGRQRDTRALLDEVHRQVTEALAELRRLASGILPPVLADHGLPAAIEELAARLPLTVEVEEMSAGRLALSVEMAAYFVVSEALTNVAKHAQIPAARLRVVRQDDRLVIEIADDGVGGVKLEAGTGLRGLDDRVGALGGRFKLESPAGNGTRIRAEIPCAS